MTNDFATFGEVIGLPCGKICAKLYEAWREE